MDEVRHEVVLPDSLQPHDGSEIVTDFKIMVSSEDLATDTDVLNFMDEASHLDRSEVPARRPKDLLQGTSQTHMLLLFRSEQFQEAAKVERKHSVSEGCGVNVQSELRAERFSTHGEVQIGYSPAGPQRSFVII